MERDGSHDMDSFTLSSDVSAFSKTSLNNLKYVAIILGKQDICFQKI